MISRSLIIWLGIALFGMYPATEVLSQAQFNNFFLYNIDTSSFPRVTGTIFAVDNEKVRYHSFNTSDFDLLENGQNKNSTLAINCDTLKQPLPVAVCLTLDQSFSMANITPAGDTYWDWASFGAKTFIDSFAMVPPSCIAVTSFGGYAYTRSPFQTIKPPLYTAIAGIPIQGGTNYDEAFLNTSNPNGSNGAVYILKQAPISLRRIMIILTDGQPDKAPSRQRIIDSCVRNGITVYAINILTSKNSIINLDLQTICDKTGGMAFLAHSKEEMGVIYQLIAKEIQRNIDCRITWTSSVGCGQASRLRTVRVTLKKGVPYPIWTGTYLAPVESVGDPLPSVSTLTFEDPGGGSSVRKNFSVKAPSWMSITLNSISSSLPTFYKIISTNPPLPVSLSPGQSVDVTVEFDQDLPGAIHTGSITIAGTPCPTTIAVNDIIPILKLESPKGGEVLPGCDSIPIQWSGVAEDEPITVMYSSNNGQKWSVIDNHASGLHLPWYHRVEHDGGTDNLLPYRIKIQRSSCLWISAFGGNANDSAHSICMNTFTRNLGIGGSFDAPMKFGTTTITSFGLRDGYFAEMSAAGSQKSAVAIGGTGDDNILSVESDRMGNYVVGGNTTSPQLHIGDSLITIKNAQTRSAYVACIDTLGKTLWCCSISDTSGTNNGEFYLTSVHTLADSSVVVQGYQRGVVEVLYPALCLPSRLSFDAPNIKDLYFPITVEISKYGRVQRFLAGFYYPSFSKASTTVLNNNQSYQCGSFDSDLHCGTSVTRSQGACDGFVRCVQLTPGADSSSKSFSIVAPLAWFEVPKISMQSVDVGKSLQYPAGQPFRNDGSVGLNLLSFFAVGVDSADFSVDPPIAPGVISPHSNPDLQIVITPRPVPHGIRDAYIIALCSCSDPAFIRVESYAKFPNLSMVGTDFERKRIGSLNYDTMYVKNADVGSIPLTTLGSAYNSWNEFQWHIILAKDSLIPGQTDIPIPVVFSPTHIERDSLEVHVDTSDAIHVRVYALAYGSGFLPRRSSQGHHFSVVPANTVSPEQGAVIIRNIDTIAPLRIYNCGWLNGQSDAFHADRVVPDTSIAPGDSLRINVEYYPLTPGFHSASFVFTHDAAPGPDLLPKNYDTVRVDGDAVQIKVDSVALHFPTILRCDADSTQFSIRNLSGGTSVHLNAPVLQQSGSNFRVAPSAAQDLVAGARVVYTVYYSPTSVGPASALIIVQPDQSLPPDTVRVSANSVTASLSIAASDTTADVGIGSQVLFPVVGSLSSSTAFQLDTMSFLLSTHPFQAKFNNSRFQASAYGWTWKQTMIGDNVLLEGSYAGGPLSNPIHFCDLPFDVVLNRSYDNVMKIVAHDDVVKDCFFVDSASITLHEIPGCYTQGSMVVATIPLSLTVSQHDATTLTIHYDTDGSGPLHLDVFSVLGQNVKSVDIPRQNAGSYSMESSISQLSAGLYYCRLTNAFGFVVRPISIAR